MSIHNGREDDDFIEVAKKDDGSNETDEVRAVLPPKGYVTHPGAAKLFKKAPFLKNIPMFGKATDAFGPKLTVSLGVTNALVKGAAGYIISNSMQGIFTNRYKLDASRYNRLSSMYTMGWSLQCFIAPLSDLFPLLGYTKRWYVFLSLAVGGCFAFGYGLMPAKPSSGNAAGAFLFLTSMGKANVDILLQGLYSREMRKAPAAGAELVSWVWWMIFVGDFITLIQGPLTDAGIPHVGVIISAVLQILPAVFSFFNWYGEKTNKVERLEDAQRNYDEQFVREDMTPALAQLYHYLRRDGKYISTRDKRRAHKKEHGGRRHAAGATHPDADHDHDYDHDHDVLAPPVGQLPEERPPADEGCVEGRLVEFKEPDVRTYLCGALEFNCFVAIDNARVLIFCAVMTAAVIVLAVVTLLGSDWDLLWCCIAVLVVTVGGAYCALPLVLANASMMIFAVFLFYLSFSGGLNDFYLATPDCVPDGPHFSSTFYYTVGSLLTYCAGLAGCMLFPPIFSRRRYQATFAITTLFQVIASLFDLMIVERWAVRIGIPDHAIYLCGYAIIFEFVHVMSFMPVEVLNSRLVPRGCEAMIFSIISAFSSLGQTMATSFGSILMDLGFPVKSTVPCDFKNLRYLIIIGHLCMPLVIVPLSFLLLPNCRVCDDVDIHGNVIRRRRTPRGAKAPSAGGNQTVSREPVDEEGDAGQEEPGAVPKKLHASSGTGGEENVDGFAVVDDLDHRIVFQDRDDSNNSSK